jgi:hypothetical protein
MPDITDMWRALRAEGHDEDEVQRLTAERWPGEPVRLAEAGGHTVVYDGTNHERDDLLVILAWNQHGVCDERVIAFDYGDDRG